jgi:uncharacterized protein (TIGR02284 family)
MDLAKTISTLNELLHVSTDGAETFEKAVGMTDDTELEGAFRTALHSCMIARDQLRTRIAELGGRASAGGTVPGTFHRAWIDARTLLARDDERALLDEVVRAERAAVKRYDAALAEPLPEDERPLIESQASGARANLKRFEELASASD